ncbi:uncharacterized protein [Primulina huaijiensis]|uniref:uncharacterized protein n=1 Tax=Primulina huaijiensis TaxID=1492673 RepID=UPI003CC6FEEA
MNGRVSFIPNQSFKSKHGGAAAKVGENKKRFFQIWAFKLPNGSGFSPARFLRHIGTKVEVALQYVSSRSRRSRKVSSASFTRSRSYADTLDSQRAEAIEDCIDFLNSSSTLQRSNSVASSC